MFDTKEALEAAFHIGYLERLEFFSPDIEKEVLHKCQKKLTKQKHARVNHWTLALFERELTLHKEMKYLIKRVNPLVGYGVFAKEAIQELSFIGEYTGVVRKRRLFKDRKNDYVFGYVIGPDDTRWVIDAEKKGNFTRFINHSYEPNITSKWVIHEGIGRILFFANRSIAVGEQITYDYGPYYWKRRPYPMYL